MKSSKALASSSAQNLKVTVYWGDILYDTVYCGAKDSVTVGRKPSNTVVVPLEGQSTRDSLEIIKVLDDNSVELLVDESIQGHVRLGNEFLRLQVMIDEKRTEPTADGLHKIKMGDTDEADLVIGHVSFYLNWTKDKVVLPKTIQQENKKNLLLSGLTTLALLVMMGIINLINLPEPPPPPERLVTLKPKDPPIRAKAAVGKKKTKTGGAKKGPAGKKKLTTKPKLTEAQKLQKELSGDLVKDLADLGNIAPNRRRPKEDAAVAAAIDQAGTGGFTTEGFKTGAGGKSKGLGRTVGQGEGGFEGTGRLALSGNSSIEGSKGYGKIDTVVDGGLDRAVIDAIVRKRKARIRLCYERQLNFDPKLAGKVSVHFVIAGNGKVKSARISEDTMRSNPVNQCIINEVRTWVFPRPKGGTLVDVDYPFVFESSVKN